MTLVICTSNSRNVFQGNQIITFGVSDLREVMKRFGLSALIYPTSPAEFRRDFWPRNLFVAHGSLDRFSPITRIPQLSNIQLLIEAWKGYVNAWPPPGSCLPVFKAEPHQLMQFYQAGYTLYFRDVGHVVPELNPISRALERDLGLQEGDIFCDAFASQGPGAAPHFDPDMSFNLQLIGSKRWKFSKNNHVTFPLDGASMYQEPSEELTDYSRLPFPKKMPTRSISVEAKTGTLFFIPHGMWHETKNHEPSLLLSFTVLLKSNARLLADEIHERLKLHEHWRERNGNLASPLIEIKKRREQLSILLEDLKKTVNALDTNELLMKWSHRSSSHSPRTLRKKKNLHQRSNKSRVKD